MKSALRDRSKLVGKKFNRLVRKTKRSIYFTELLIKRDEKYKDSNLKHIFLYDLWTRKTPEQLISKLNTLELLVSEVEKFIDQFDKRLRAWI